MTALPQSYFFYTTGVDRVTGIFENVGNTWPHRVPLFQLGLNMLMHFGQAYKTK